MFRVLSSVFLGWSLGSNDSANVFGTAVASRSIKYSTAIVLAAVFILTGAMFEGIGGINTLGDLTSQTFHTAFLASLAAGITVTAMTVLNLPVSTSQAIIVHFYAKIGVPVSTSQAVIGAVLGIGLLKGVQTIHFKVLLGILFGWAGTPLIAGIISYGLFLLFG
jgi:inorganic phosphate transporter, PiT family